MIKQLQNFSDLGTPLFLSTLIDRMQEVEKKEWQFSEIHQLFASRRIDGISNIFGCLELFKYIGVLTETKIDYYVISPDLLVFSGNQKRLSIKFIKLLFDSLAKDPIFYDIFSDQFLTFDSLHNSYVIKNGAFGYNFSRLRQLLLDFDFLVRSDKGNSYLINNGYKEQLPNFFHKSDSHRKISVSEFYSSMEQKRIYGEQAESFVVKFEQDRLKGLKLIEWVAQVTVNDGYDIASFDDSNDNEFNRFIEVKSYTGNNQYFYLSKNELIISKRKGIRYWLYLVNRDKINDLGYIPTMIQNPFKNVFTSDNWEKEEQNWRFQEIK